jgi:hypothetical protein
MRAKRANFSPEEDRRLRQLVSVFGTNCWDMIAAGLQERNGRQCRERWKHYLSSDLRPSPWTLDEDRHLFMKMQELGPRWTFLASHFPGRTDLQVKHRWMQRFAWGSCLHLRNRYRNGTLPMPETQAMAKPKRVPKAKEQEPPDESIPTTPPGEVPEAAEDYLARVTCVKD